MALSKKRPSGSPPAIPIRPPAGWGVPAVTPSSCRARLFTTRQWPQARTAQTGTSVETASRSYRSGIRRVSENRSWFQPRPISQASPWRGCPARKARMHSSISARLPVCSASWGIWSR